MHFVFGCPAYPVGVHASACFSSRKAVLQQCSPNRFVSMSRIVFTAMLMHVLSGHVEAADWPMYRADAARSGYTADTLPTKLALRWTYRAADPPEPAWPRSTRLTFDRANEPIVAGGRLFFGSSATSKLYALDTATGQEMWTFFTGGPIRFAPVAWRDHVFVVSDDGHLYALSAADGSLSWKHRGGPDGSMRLGNQRMISKWRARGGPVVLENTLYYAAGIWPSDGIFIYALDAESGKIKWVNDDSGGIYMPQPHGKAVAASGVSAHGHLVVLGEQLFVPTGRAVPAAFDRLSGEFQYFRLQENQKAGGSFSMAADQYVLNSGLLIDARTGAVHGKFGGGAICATPDALVHAQGGFVAVYHWQDVENRDRKGQAVTLRLPQRTWFVGDVHTGANVIVAGETIVSAGDGHVDLIDASTRKRIQSLPVDGVAHGLAVSNGQLFIATNQGTIHCFGRLGPAAANVVTARKSASLDFGNTEYAAAAEEIIQRCDVSRGYCLDIGCGDGALAFELAKRTQLYVCGIEADATKVAEARRKLDAAGLYGSRVVVHHADLHASGYPDYFANLIVSGRSVREGANVVPMSEVKRTQRPYGGVSCIGRPGQMNVSMRGELPGAGSWTHQYADPANRGCSDDTLIRGKLGMLWFRDVDMDLVQRHGRAPAPLFAKGRLFYVGLDELRALDAYNGHELWRYSLPGVLRPYHGDTLMGTSGTGGICCVADDSVYIRREDICLRIDVATGKKLGEFRAPAGDDGKSGPWGYIACAGGILYGSSASPDHVVTYRWQPGGDMTKTLTESTMLFAMDARTGELKWKYEAKHSIRHNAIAIDGGRVYLIDRPLALYDRVRRSDPKTRTHPYGELVALDAVSGEEIWRRTTDVYGTMLAVSTNYGVLIMGYQPGMSPNDYLDSELGARLSGIDISDGTVKWTAKEKYSSRLMVNDRTVYGETGIRESLRAWDLVTGEARTLNIKRTYACGIFSSSRTMMFFRSATLGYFDLQKNDRVKNFGGMRPGCWINTIPAGGIVLIPDASAGCGCSYLNQCWLALEPLPYERAVPCRN